MAGANHLRVLLEVGAGDGSFAMFEHDEPLDIRAGTRVRWGRSLFRIAPGGWERPVSIIEDAWMRLRYTDLVLRPQLGFGIFDLVDVALRHGDEVLAHLENFWPRNNPGADEEPWSYGDGFVTRAEVDAVGVAPTLSQTIERCPDPVAAAAAVEWASTTAVGLRCEPNMTSGLFGPVLAVDDLGIPAALPVGFLLDGIHESVAVLTDLALREPGQPDQLLRAASARTLHLLSGRGAPLAPDPWLGDDKIVAVQRVQDGLLLAVDIAAAVDGYTTGDAERRLAAFGPGTTFATRRGEITISEQDEVIRLVVIHGTDSVAFMRGDDDVPISWLTAEDLRWIMTQAERADDLIMFLRAWQARNAEHTFSFGPFDMWEFWSSNGGAFHRRGQPLTGLFFSPHSERAEWHWHANKGWAERALRDVGLTRLAGWPVVVEDDDQRVVRVVDRPAGDAAQLVRTSDGGTVTAIRYDPTDDGVVSATSIAAAICWKFRHLDAHATLAAPDGTARIEVRHGGTDVISVERAGDVIIVSMGADLPAALAAGSVDVENTIGAGIASVIEPAHGPGFAARWRAAPMGIVLDLLSVPQTTTGLSDLRGPHPSLISDADRAMAERLFADGVERGTRRGTDARDLESQTIYPIVVKHLHDCFAAFNPDILVRELLTDLERSMASRWREEADHARRADLAASVAAAGLEPDDIVSKVAESRNERTVLTRIVMLCIEEALRHPPPGTATPTAFQRDRIYAVARHVLEAGMRSETLHQGLSETTIEITDGYEVEIHHAPGDLDFDALSYSRAERSMPERPALHASPPDEPTPLCVALPNLVGIEAAIQARCGFGIDALLGVPDALTSWPVSNDEPVASATIEEVAEFCADALALPIDHAQLEAAVRWYTLDPAGLATDLRNGAIEHWELNRRSYRLATRPLIPTGDGRVLIGPWTAGYTRTIVAGNLLDGRLPWPEHALPDAVVTALKRYRRQRNAELEREALAAFDAVDGFAAIGNVKKAKMLGIPTLPREIDVLVIDESRGRIWVVEVKDRTIAWSPHQVRSAIDEFNGNNGYVSKVLANVELIASHATTVSTKLGATSRDGWDVRGAIVTRRIEPAAYVAEPAVVFSLVGAIADTFDRDELPVGRYK